MQTLQKYPELPPKLSRDLTQSRNPAIIRSGKDKLPSSSGGRISEASMVCMVYIQYIYAI